MFLHPCLKGAGGFPHIIFGAPGAMDVVYHAAFLEIRGLVFRMDENGAEGAERLVVCVYSLFFDDIGQFFLDASDIRQAHTNSGLVPWGVTTGAGFVLGRRDLECPFFITVGPECRLHVFDFSVSLLRFGNHVVGSA